MFVEWSWSALPERSSVLLYSLTLFLGVCGNVWVISSVLRSRRLNRSSHLNASDRLRAYIGLLASIDLLICGALALKLTYTLWPQWVIGDLECQLLFTLNRLSKLCSLSCLACISVERFLTIRKPFNNRVRKQLVQLTPVLSFAVMVPLAAAILLMAGQVRSIGGGTNCALMVVEAKGSSNQMGGDSTTMIAITWVLTLGFLLQLSAVSLNYAQIVHHVRKTFWQRKARVEANSGKQPLMVSEPKYMRDMTAAIVRIALFHFLCWMPYCLAQLVPDTLWGSDGYSMSGQLLAGVRLVPSSPPTTNVQPRVLLLQWIAFAIDWLTYVNSAGDWIFYAALNRELRSLIKATTERRKRSNMSQLSPSGHLHQSLRRHMNQSIRFFYSINSYRSSFDESCHGGSGSIHNGGVSTAAAAAGFAGAHLIHCNSTGSNGSNGSTTTTSVYARAEGARKASSNIGGVLRKISERGVFGMRDGRAYSYCSPAVGTTQQRSVSVLGARSDRRQCFSTSPPPHSTTSAQQQLIAIATATNCQFGGARKISAQSHRSTTMEV